MVIEAVGIDHTEAMAGVGDAACVEAGVMSKGMSKVVTSFRVVSGEVRGRR